MGLTQATPQEQPYQQVPNNQGMNGLFMAVQPTAQMGFPPPLHASPAVNNQQPYRHVAQPQSMPPQQTEWMLQQPVAPTPTGFAHTVSPPLAAIPQHQHRLVYQQYGPGQAVQPLSQMQPSGAQQQHLVHQPQQQNYQPPQQYGPTQQQYTYQQQPYQPPQQYGPAHQQHRPMQQQPGLNGNQPTAVNYYNQFVQVPNGGPNYAGQVSHMPNNGVAQHQQVGGYGMHPPQNMQRGVLQTNHQYGQVRAPSPQQNGYTPPNGGFQQPNGQGQSNGASQVNGYPQLNRWASGNA
jgi:hypothetical protein